MSVNNNYNSDNNNDNDNDDQEEEEGKDEEAVDLDAFLTEVESKLRGPFSSLEFSRAVHTHSLRGGSVVKYLENLSAVLARTDKVIQSRILIGLLGLEQDTKDPTVAYKITKQLYHVVQQAQTSPTHEQWARIIAGLVQGILFTVTVDESGKDHPPNEQRFSRPCRGSEASKQLSKLCEDVCSTVIQTIMDDEDVCKDMNASFVPYHYSLLPPDLIQLLVPDLPKTTTNHNDFSTNVHFHVPTNASILLLDQSLEAQRAKDELDHQQPSSLVNSNKQSGLKNRDAFDKDSETTATAILPPGFRPTKLVSSKSSALALKNAAAASTKPTNMFMKSTTLNSHRQPQQTLLRRKGQAQSLVSKTKMSTLAAGNSSTTTTTTNTNTNTPTSNAATPVGINRPSTTVNRAVLASRMQARVGLVGQARGAIGSSSSSSAARTNGKMKMIDLDEVAQLGNGGGSTEKQDDPTNSSSTVGTINGTLSLSSTTTGSRTTMMSKKRRIMEAAALSSSAAGPPAKKVPSKLESDPKQPSPKTQQGDGITCATGTFASQHQQPSGGGGTGGDVGSRSSYSNTTTDDWKLVLQERCNKLSQDEKERIQQFFIHRYNPNPSETIVKLKLHEQRTIDPITGQEMKETFYLELDYINFTSKQSRKVKRY